MLGKISDGSDFGLSLWKSFATFPFEGTAPNNTFRYGCPVICFFFSPKFAVGIVYSLRFVAVENYLWAEVCRS